MRVEQRDVQSFGEDPLDVRDTSHYAHEYVKPFVERWDEVIDWERREKSEGDFFIDLFREKGVRTVLDAATGTGFHSVRLLNAGFDVVSVDGSRDMLMKAFSNAQEHDHVLRTVHADWRWLTREVATGFDAVVCLGNSFTHLFHEKDRRKALAEFYSVLKPDGILVLDQRNYDAILDRDYSNKHVYYYCGEDVEVEPEHVDEGLARFQYAFPNGDKYHLNMFPLREAYTQRLIREAGFQDVQTYGDFQETHAAEQPDFFIHVASKTAPTTEE